MNTELGDAGKLMAELGEMSPDEIAAKLSGLGIQGKCEHPQRCAIAMYLKRMTGMTGDVGLYTWAIWSPGEDLAKQDGPIVRGRNPQSVTEFINNFDTRSYPELIEGTVRI